MSLLQPGPIELGLLVQEAHVFGSRDNRFDSHCEDPSWRVNTTYARETLNTGDSIHLVGIQEEAFYNE